MSRVGVGSAVVAYAGRSIEVSPDHHVIIGREPDCDIVVDDPLVSRHHARVECADGEWVVNDLGSRNGLYIDGEQTASPIRISPGRTDINLGGANGPLVTLSVTSATTEIRIGRDPDNDIALADDLLVSRHHAVIRQGTIEDLGSHNGTFVNGRQAGRIELAEGDVVSIGQTQFRYEGGALHEWKGGPAVRFAASGLFVQASSGAVLLDGVDLQLGPRSLLGVVGPSGAGKSTLLGALTGLRPADRGTVSYEGRDLYADYDELRRRIGLVPQDDVLHLQLTVRQALEYAAELRFPSEVIKAERDARVAEVMAELGLTARADLRIEQLSGGQRKRTSVAVELLTKPSLMFLDEPTSGLDPGYERSLMQLLRELADGDRTVVVVTHSVSSLSLCDQVLVLAPGGRPAYLGPPDDAPAYFGCADYQGIFQTLTDDDAGTWATRFAASRVAQPASTTGDRNTPKPPKGGFRQLSTLTRRYAAVVKADRTMVITMAVQAPALGILQYLVLARHELAPPPAGALRIFSSAAALMLNPVQIATALGLANAVRELVKERALFRRERAAGLSIPAYLASKVILLGSVAVLQAIILVGLTLIDEGGPKSATVLGSAFVELSAAIALTGIAAMTLGLAISAWASTENLATTIMPIVIVLQNVLSLGGLQPGALSKPVLNQAQYASSAQWGFAATAATIDLNQLQGLSGLFKEVKVLDATTIERLIANPQAINVGQRRYRHARSAWLADMAALAALAVAGLVVAALGLARLDPILRR